MNIVFLGPPGAGKGTQSLRVSRALGVAHISTGDMLRRFIKEGHPIGLEAQRYIDRGNLVPDEMVINMVRRRLAEDDCADGALLDGFPRTLEQAYALERMVPLDVVVNIEVADARLIERLSGRRVCGTCGSTYHISTLEGTSCPVCDTPLILRPDDDAVSVKNRIRIYHSQTQPLIDYYAAKGALLTVDGDRPPDDVTNSVLEALKMRI